MKVAIAGYGIEGAVSYSYWQKSGADVTIVDERDEFVVPDGAKVIKGVDAFSHLADFDMVVRTPSLPPNKIHTNGKVWSATNEFFEKCPAIIIGVTGTKGKGTTSSLIASILRAAGKKVHLVGNIGLPALKVLPVVSRDDIIVYELSSFQLWDVQYSPHIAVVLPIEPDHLDVHNGVEDYIEAKANIRRYQSLSDNCIYHPTNELARRVASTQLVRVPEQDSIEFADRYGVKDEDEVYVQNGFFCVQDRKICDIKNLTLPGMHNIENACAAISAITELIDWPSGIDGEDVARGLRSFSGLPHRLKFVKEVDGVRYYDDSISTTPGSVIAAVNSFPDSDKIVILGGSDKGADYSDLISFLRSHDVSVVAMGTTGKKIAELCNDAGVECLYVDGKVDTAVVRAHQRASAGAVVLLSPASASFDQYSNYAARGDEFIAAVARLRER